MKYTSSVGGLPFTFTQQLEVTWPDLCSRPYCGSLIDETTGLYIYRDGELKKVCAVCFNLFNNFCFSERRSESNSLRISKKMPLIINENPLLSLFPKEEE